MFKSSIRLWLFGMAVGLALAGLGCGGDGGPIVPLPGPAPLPPVDPDTAGTLSVHLVQDGPPGNLRQLNLLIGKLEVRSGGVWRPVYQPGRLTPVDILDGSSGGGAIALATQVPWPPDPDDALRFTLLTGSTVQFESDDPDTTHPLATPVQFVSPLGLPGSFSVPTGGATDLTIAFSVDNVVQQDPEDFEKYVFFPGPVRGYDKAATGRILGQVADAAGVPVTGAVVTAQLLTPGGFPATDGSLRTVLTDQAGEYVLDLLPTGSAYTWTAVSLAFTGSPSCFGTPGQVSGTLGDAPPYDQFQCPIVPEVVQYTGEVLGTVTPPPVPGQAERVDLVQAFQPNALGSCPLEVASAPVGADGRFSFSPSGDLPVGIYTAVLHRFSLGPDLSLVDTPVATGPILVQSGVELKLSF